jgi:hypothetical protein
MADDWYYVQHGESIGPVTDEQLRELLSSGALKFDDMVWHDGMEAWEVARNFPSLQSLPPIPLPPIPRHAPAMEKSKEGCIPQEEKIPQPQLKSVPKTTTASNGIKTIISLIGIALVIYIAIHVFSGVVGGPSPLEQMITTEMQDKFSMFKDQYEISEKFDNNRGSIAVVTITDPKLQDPSYHKYITFILEKDQANTGSYRLQYNYISSINPPTDKEIKDASSGFK